MCMAEKARSACITYGVVAPILSSLRCVSMSDTFELQDQETEQGLDEGEIHVKEMACTHVGMCRVHRVKLLASMAAN